MRPDEWAQVKSLFEAASALPVDAREPFLADAVSDRSVLREVRLLLAADAEATGGWADRLSETIAEHVSLRALEPGQTIGPYRIDQQIGRGGMGIVYRAHDTRLKRPVALKLVDAVTLDAAARAALLHEAQCASALNHPHVCTVFDFGEYEGDPYIVMEWIDGRPLSSATSPAGLPTEDALRYGVQIAAALAHAHSCGVVHGDLKTANVLITRDQRAKLLDFGVARLSRDADTSPAVSLPHGTPVYMAPEVLTSGTTSERSDIWSFGCVLHELLTGTLPFARETRSALTSAILDDAPAPLPPGVPESIRLVAARCVSKEPSDRYRDGTELGRALNAAIAGTSTAKADDRSVVTVAVSSRHAAVAPEAYTLYQRGRALMWRGTRRDFEAAVQTFERVARLEPNFALAEAGLAYACGRIRRLYDRDEKWQRKGRAAAERALALQPQLPEALVALAYLHYADEQYEDAVRFARMAIERKEDCEGAYHALGVSLNMLDKLDEAAALVDRAVETGGHDYRTFFPFLTILERLGAIEKVALLQDRLRRQLESHVGWVPDNAQARILLGTLYARANRRDEAQRETDIAVAFDPDDPATLLNAACTYAILGFKGEAIALLRRAIQNGYRHVEFLKRDPDLASLRDEPEFQRLLVSPSSRP